MPNSTNPNDLPEVPTGFISVYGTLKHETPKAILLELDYEVEPEDSKEPVTQIWIPMSQVYLIHREVGCDNGTVYISDWIASKKGL